MRSDVCLKMKMKRNIQILFFFFFAQTMNGGKEKFGTRRIKQGKLGRIKKVHLTNIKSRLNLNCKFEMKAASDSFSSRTESENPTF